MPKTDVAKKTIIGKFVAAVGLVVLALLLVFWWRAYRAPNELLILYFGQSVHGIDIGTPVKIMGVAVGQIEKIDIGAPNPGENEYYPAVHLRLDDKKLKKAGMEKNLADLEVLKKETDRGLRAKLTLISPLQGDYFINLVFEPKEPAVFFRPIENNEPEVPVINTNLDPAIQDATKFLQKFSQTDFLKIERDINDSLDELQQSLAPENFERFNSDVTARLENVHAILDDPAITSEIKNVNERLEEIRTKIQTDGADFLAKTEDGLRIMKSLRESLKKIGAQTQEVGALLDVRSPNMRNIRRELRKFLTSVNDFSSSLQTPFRLAVPVTSETSKLSSSDQSGK